MNTRILSLCIILLCGLSFSPIAAQHLDSSARLGQEVEISSSEQHFYRISLEKDQNFRVILVQNGIDLQVQILDPNQELVPQPKLPSITGGKSLQISAKSSGIYTIEVAPKYLEEGKAIYRLLIPAERSTPVAKMAHIQESNPGQLLEFYKFLNGLYTGICGSAKLEFEQPDQGRWLDQFRTVIKTNLRHSFESLSR